MKYNVNLRVETYSGVNAEMYSVMAESSKVAVNAATTNALRKHGKDNVYEITVISVTEVSHAVA